MDAVEVDHYAVLGLPSGEEGAKLSDREIFEAYKTKVFQVHPDKSRRHVDPCAFVNLQSSYKVLKDEQARKSFDDRLRIERERERERKKKKKVVPQPDNYKNKKRREMMSDLQAAEERYYRQRRSNFGFGSREDEERYSRKLNEEIERVIALHSKQKQAGWSSKQKEYYATGVNNNYNGTQPNLSSKHNDGLELEEKVVKVSWEKTRVGEDYTATRLHEIFGVFGCVEDVMIRSWKKGLAVVLMESKEAAEIAIAIAETGCGLDDDVSNPLHVEILQSAECAELGNVLGATHREYEKSVLAKMTTKAAVERNPNPKLG